MSSSVSITFDRFPQAKAALQKGVANAVKKAAFDIEAHAKVNAPVDTGYLRNSVYAVTSDSSDYSHGNTGGSGKSLAEVAAPTSDQEAIVAVGAEYALYVEMGTRFMSAQPFFYPAVDQVRGTLQNVLASLINAELAKLGS